MLYRSTRNDQDTGISSAEAIKRGLAPDGGLYLPESFPALTKDFMDTLLTMDYPHRAAEILHLFLDDYSKEELLSDCMAAYAPDKFRADTTVPMVALGNGIVSMELWHGPTAAFKDMALQIMPRLLSRSLVMTGERRTALILVATSGDTGKAALEGYRDIKQTKIKVFYPENGVSRVQKLQMMTQEGENVDVTAIKGNFDDAQSGVKQIFSDDAIREELNRENIFLSSANSINWGRLVPQIVYYVSAYCDLVKNGTIAYGDKIDVTVPTGNFGNIFAAYLAKKMGLPIDRFICASNCNNILSDFLSTGVYDRNREFFQTISPSMDILISSNLERLLYLVSDPDKTRAYMESLKNEGKYQISAEEFDTISKEFVGYYTTEEETRATIRDLFSREGYLADTHTAVGYHAAAAYKKESGSQKILLLASTASPYKFAPDVYRALTGVSAVDELSAASLLEKHTGTEIHYALRGLAERTVRFTASVEVPEMPATVLSFAKA